MKMFKTIALAAVLAGFSGTALAQTGSFEEELAQLREDVTFLQRQVYKDNNAGVDSLTSSKNVSVQIGQFDELLRQVIGRTDELEFKIKKLNERLDVMNKDIDIRFKLLEGKPVSGGSGMLELPAKEKFAAPVAKDAPKSIVGDSIKGDDLKPLKGFDVKGIYQEGLEALKAGNDKLAEEKFNTILSRFPEDNLAGNAQYWLGEVYYGRKDFAKAAVAFAKGYEKYKGPKGPDSLLKLGMSMRELKKKTEACVAFTSLPTEFPKAEAALLSRAKSEAAKLTASKRRRKQSLSCLFSVLKNFA